MGVKRHSPEEIIRKLREAKVDLGRGEKMPEVCRQIGVTEQTHFRWRKEYGGSSGGSGKEKTGVTSPVAVEKHPI